MIQRGLRPHSQNYVEGKFLEVRLNRVLGSLHSPGPTPMGVPSGDRLPHYLEGGRAYEAHCTTLMLTVALVTALMMALSGPAFATIHPLANSECANDNASAVANEQMPPSLSGQSQGSPPNNGAEGTIAQPVFAVSGGDPFASPSPSPAFKTFGENIEGKFCPAA
jgi:hypothetical protein